ncbi:hypothetical protein [Deinococcus sedimenti]|uniref:DUF1990 domain-containing protein n=1 Tax=Deinococcus sedimenti TaxID=1867090 RepID=A0ABQ2S9Z9_9DEIO|nr:hypothetical protein [Deinococcus sedimenti]GGS10361.1 hypothetical protein GCM10008960_40630 [Deinococcus sedimenti]
MKVHRFLVFLAGAYAARFLRLPFNGWHGTTLRDGVGPVTRRTYWIDLAAPTRPMTDVVDSALQHLPERIPKPLAWFRRVQPGPRRTEVGDQFTILMLGVRRARVHVTAIHPDCFRLHTLKQHSESGWIECRTEPLGGDRHRLQVVSQVRASSWFDRLAYLLGVGILQRLTWEAGLRRILQSSGGRKVGHGTTTVEAP